MKEEKLKWVRNETEYMKDKKNSKAEEDKKAKRNSIMTEHVILIC